MKLHYGEVPRSETEIPPGWTEVRGPGPVGTQIIALPLGLLVALGVGWVWTQAVPLYRPGVAEVIALVTALLLLLPAHEFLHALLFPAWGKGSIIGVWPARLLCYAHYNGEMSRNRFLVVLAMPLLVLTVLPLVWAVLTGHSSLAFGFVSFVNTCGAGGDMLGLGLLLWQVPRGARVWNDGWRTYFVKD